MRGHNVFLIRKVIHNYPCYPFLSGALIECGVQSSRYDKDGYCWPF